MKKSARRTQHGGALFTETAQALQAARSARAFLPTWPAILCRHLPFSRCVLYYRDAEGNVFRPFGAGNGESPLPPLAEECSLVESFTGRSDFLLTGPQNRMFFELFDRDSNGLFADGGFNLVIPLRAHKYFRGLLLARVDAREEKSVRPLADAVQAAAAMFIPLVEAEQMEFENDKNYYRLFKFDRLVLLGQMAASLAHELRTPLTTVLFEISAIRERLVGDGAVAAAYEKINREIRRANGMIESLLVFSKFKDLKLAEVRLREFIECTLREIPARKIPPQVTIRVSAEKEIVVSSDGDRLKQVFINVLFNALEALSERSAGTIAVRLYSQYDELPRNIRHVIAVSDDGPGIPDAIKERVLQPFFTTKKDGTGLGLYISYSIMKTLRGDLEIHSSGLGTRVDLILPAR
ncbi:MAG: HAMP domain-containing histidine kinase [Candidatus Aminicenantes bacterium]|nr:HAMP domain-containing histidine kinase [Candidatus Aminicenantes bacterium]